MSLAAINCLGCGAPVSQEYKLCSRCCDLLGVINPSEGYSKESSSENLEESGLADVLPHADRTFIIGFFVLSLSSVVILGWLGLTLMVPMGLKFGSLMGCLC